MGKQEFEHLSRETAVAEIRGNPLHRVESFLNTTESPYEACSRMQQKHDSASGNSKDPLGCILAADNRRLKPARLFTRKVGACEKEPPL